MPKPEFPEVEDVDVVAGAKPSRRTRVHSVARRAPNAPLTSSPLSHELRTMFDPANVHKKKEKRVAIQ